MHLYLAPWAADLSSDMSPCWVAPHTQKCIGLLDRRSLPQCGRRPTMQPRGVGLFVYREPVVISDAFHLGDDPARNFVLADRQAVSRFLGLGETMVSGRLLDLIIEMDLYGDPAGLTRWKPFRGTPARGFRLRLGDIDVRRRWADVDEAYRRQSYAVDHVDWRRHKQEFAVSQHWRRTLTAYAEKYRMTPDALLQLWGEPWVQAWPRHTVYGDTFVEASDTDLASHTATGPNGGWAWTVVAGSTLTVIAASDDLRTSGTPDSFGRSTTVGTDTDAQYIQADQFTTNKGAGWTRHGGVAGRVTDSANYYWYRLGYETSVVRIDKVVNWVASQLATASYTYTAGVSVLERAEVTDLDYHTIDLDGVEIVNVSDNTFIGVYQFGVRGRQAEAGQQVVWDNLEVGDLAAAAASWGGGVGAALIGKLKTL